LRELRPNTQAGRLLRILVRRYPEWSNVEHFGYDGYSCRNRMDDALGVRGFKIARQAIVREDGKKLARYEWRLATEEIYHRAALLVRSWDTGEDFATLVERDPLLARLRERTQGDAAGAGQEDLFAG